jgi:hypothetical protein
MLYSNFAQEIWFTPKDEVASAKPLRVLLKTVPYRFTEIFRLSDYHDSTDIERKLLNYCILDIENIVSDVPVSEIIKNPRHYLPSDLINEMVEFILDLWLPSEEFTSTMVATVELMVDPRFSDNTWNCQVCQRRKLDVQRNCPLIEGTEHLDPNFAVPFMGETITICPVSEKDEQLGQVILEGYNFKDAGFLPEPGSMGDQPVFFVVGTQALSDRIKYFKRRAEEEALQKTSS